MNETSRLGVDPYSVAANAEIDRVFDKARLTDYGGAYVGLLREDWRAVGQSLGRTATLFVLLASVFYLLTLPGTVSELSLGPIRLIDLTLALEFLPFVTAYLFYDFTVLSSRWQLSKKVFQELMRRLHPEIFEANLETLIQPQLPSFTGQSDHYLDILGRHLIFSKLLGWVNAYIFPFCFAFLLPISFEIVAYVYLFGQLPGFGTTISAVGASVLVLLSLSHFLWVPYGRMPRSIGESETSPMDDE